MNRTNYTGVLRDGRLYLVSARAARHLKLKTADTRVLERHSDITLDMNLGTIVRNRTGATTAQRNMDNMMSPVLGDSELARMDYSALEALVRRARAEMKCRDMYLQINNMLCEHGSNGYTYEEFRGKKDLWALVEGCANNDLTLLIKRSGDQ